MVIQVFEYFGPLTSLPFKYLALSNLGQVKSMKVLQLHEIYEGFDANGCWKIWSYCQIATWTFQEKSFYNYKIFYFRVIVLYVISVKRWMGSWEYSIHNSIIKQFFLKLYFKSTMSLLDSCRTVVMYNFQNKN